MNTSEYNRRARDRQIYHRKRWSGLSHEEIMKNTMIYYREKFLEHISDLIFLKKYTHRKIFLSIFAWTPLAIWIVPFVYRFRHSKSWMQLNAMVVILEMILILMLIFK